MPAIGGPPSTSRRPRGACLSRRGAHTLASCALLRRALAGEPREAQRRVHGRLLEDLLHRLARGSPRPRAPGLHVFASFAGGVLQAEVVGDT